MSRPIGNIVAGLGLFLLTICSSQAASLRVAPVILDLAAPTAASTLHLWNDAPRPINVQVRVFRWLQQNGAETYMPTNDVAVSPPITTLEPGGENIVRIVRISKKPVTGEESYRVIVDELPDPSERRNGTIVFVVRQSIPVFFRASTASAPKVSWSVAQRGGSLLVTARNLGSTRLKITNLTLSAGNMVLARKDGLVGYALGDATMSWLVPRSGRGVRPGGALSLRATSETGSFRATTRLSGG